MRNINFFLKPEIELKENFIAKFIGWLSLFLIIFPFVGLSIYNAPQAEDFTVYVVSQAHSFPTALKNWYFGWSGRYSSNSLVLLLEPLRYKILPMSILLPIAQLLLFGFSVQMVFRKLVFPNNKNSILISTGLSLYLYFHSLPSIFEGFFWTPGSMPYTLPISLSLINLCWLVEGNLSKFKKGLILFFIFIIGGSSEITPIFYGLVSVGLIFLKWRSQLKLDRFFGTHFILFLLFSLFEYIAPGNFERASLIPIDKTIPVRDIGYSLLKTLNFIKSWGFIWFFRSPTLLIGGSIFLLMYSENQNIRTKRQSAFFITFILSAFATIFTPFFFYFVSVSVEMPNRLANIAYFCFLTAIISSMGLFASSMKSDLSENKGQSLFIQRYALLFLFIGVLFSFMYPNKLYKSYEDLLTGRAKRYSQTLALREKQIRESKLDTVIVPKITDIPYSLFLIDICEDPKDWKNEGYARYYGKKALIAQ